MIDLRLDVTGSRKKARKRGAVKRLKIPVPVAKVLAEDSEKRGEREVARRTGKSRTGIRMWRGVRVTGDADSAATEFRGQSRGRGGRSVSNEAKAATVEEQTGNRILEITPDQEESVGQAVAELVQQAVEAELPYESQNKRPQHLDRRARRIVRKHGPVR